MKLIEKFNNQNPILRAFFSDDNLTEKNLLTTKNALSEFLEQNLAYICLGERKAYDFESFKTTVETILKFNTRNFQIDSASFVTETILFETVVKTFVDQNEYMYGKGLYSAKTTKPPHQATLHLLVPRDYQEVANKSLILAELVNQARYFQAMPPNVCNSEWLAEQIAETFKNVKSSQFSIKILNKKQIEREKMGLFLSVNQGSAFEPRLVVLEYNGNPESQDKIALVGKGITFDAGGYNLKGSQHILGMKFDMSGAAICAAVLKGVVLEKPKINVVAILPLTDNKISSYAQTPDSIWTAMNGKTVEVNNTDAEGRLVLADAITYAIKKAKATEIVDVATLTGAIVVALGETYTGVWSTCNKRWKTFKKAACSQNELVWRMPFHNDFAKNIKKAAFADYKNTDLSGKGGSNAAAMFLKEFTENKPYLHLDIAGTGGTGEQPRGIMVKTLIAYLVARANSNEY